MSFHSVFTAERPQRGKRALLTWKAKHMFGLKMGELVIILLAALVLFGGAKLPQLGSSLGQAIRNFKKGFGGEEQTPPETTQQRAPGSLAGGVDADGNPRPRTVTPSSKDV
jgi:sec-independent protein translocase protein TatA